MCARKRAERVGTEQYCLSLLRRVWWGSASAVTQAEAEAEAEADAESENAESRRRRGWRGEFVARQKQREKEETEAVQYMARWRAHFALRRVRHTQRIVPRL